ncbi:FAD-binding protein [Rhodobacteraceae bacterium M382]|nr:FAD-binding protein [Rhodobacteraceae bacterium M382]
MSRPESEAELAERVAAARGPLWIQGGGTRGLSVSGDLLSVSGLSGVALYEPGALTLVARAGTPVAEIETLLAGENQRLAFEPMDHRGLMGTTGEPTIGGVFAANTSGPRRVQSGAARDHLLGVRFVDGAGQVVKNGGRVMKNVTGYDLVKLMAGAHGTLGVLSEVSLKVLPRAQCSGTLVWSGLDFQASLRVFCAALKSPFDVTGAARLPQQGESPARTLIRVEGFEASVEYRMQELCQLFADQKPDDLLLGGPDTDRLWRAVRDVAPFHGRAGSVWKTSVKPTDMTRVTACADYEHVIDWGGGLIWTLAPPGVDLRSQLAGVDGHVTLIRAPQDDLLKFGRFHPQPPVLSTLAGDLRKRFDPRGILNPGVMG